MNISYQHSQLRGFLEALCKGGRLHHAFMQKILRGTDISNLSITKKNVVALQMLLQHERHVNAPSYVRNMFSGLGGPSGRLIDGQYCLVFGATCTFKPKYTLLYKELWHLHLLCIMFPCCQKKYGSSLFLKIPYTCSEQSSVSF